MQKDIDMLRQQLDRLMAEASKPGANVLAFTDPICSVMDQIRRATESQHHQAVDMVFTPPSVPTMTIGDINITINESASVDILKEVRSLLRRGRH